MVSVCPPKSDNADKGTTLPGKGNDCVTARVCHLDVV